MRRGSVSQHTENKKQSAIQNTAPVRYRESNIESVVVIEMFYLVGLAPQDDQEPLTTRRGEMKVEESVIVDQPPGAFCEIPLSDQLGDHDYLQLRSGLKLKSSVSI